MGKEIQVQSAGVARRLWRRSWRGQLGLAALLLAVLLGPLPAPASAQEAGDPALLPEVWGGFDGISKPGRWLTIRAVVANEGPPLDGELRVTSRPGLDAVYTQPIELPTRARKLVTLQVPGPSNTATLRLTLSSNNVDLASREIPIRMLPPTDFLVGVLTDDSVVPSGLGAVRRGGNPVAIARLTPPDLPAEPLTFQALDALVIRQASSDRLTPDQRASLRGWVEHGGQLIVAGGPGWRRSMDGLDDLLPVEGLRTEQLSHLRALDYYAGSAPKDGDVLVTPGQPVAGARVLLAQDSVPLVTERWLGQGRVTYLGMDPALEPFRSWPAAEALWQRVLVGGRAGLPAFEATSSTAPALRGALAELLDLGLPAAGLVIVFLMGYVVVVGPGQYLLLRRLDRREWAWIGFPLLALGAAGLVVGSAAWLRGPDVRVAAISMVRIPENTQTAEIDTFVGLVAPSRSSYSVTLEDGPVPRPVVEIGGGGAAMTVETAAGGGPPRLPELRLEGRVPRSVQWRSLAAVPTPVTSELRTAAGRVEGEIVNSSPDPLEDVMLVAGNDAISLGDVPPGERRPVSLSLPVNLASGAWQNGPPPWQLPGPRPNRGRPLVSQVFQPNGRANDGARSGDVVLLAWAPAPPPSIVLQDGRTVRSGRRLIVQALPVEYGAEQVTIPPGLIGRTVLEGTVSGRGNVSSFVTRGQLVLQFDLPPGLELAQIDRLSVHLAVPGRPAGVPASLPVTTPSSSTTPAAPRISLYRWADRTWVEVPLHGTGVATIPSGEAFVDGGAIRARVEPQGMDVQIDQLDLSLDGVRQ